jgi:CheY-like chemotaxis protein
MTPISLTAVIDDDDIALNIAQWHLKKHPLFAESLGFNSPVTALEEFEKMTNSHTPLPNVVLLDLNMPVMDGWEVLEMLKANKAWGNIPVAIITSSIDPLDRLKASGNPQVFDFIEKPYSPEKLNKLAEKLHALQQSKASS